MNPTIFDVVEQNNILTFTLSNVNVSIANAIRRIILSEIPTICFETIPESKNKSIFYENTGRLNNEILKQRLSCIPIHITDLDFPLDEYILEVNINNNTDQKYIVTTADFKIKNKKIDKYLNDEQVIKIFPPDPITNNFIDFCRLRPKISDTLPGDKLHFTCEFSISNAKNNGTFNVVSTCCYKNTQDIEEIDKQKSIKQKEFEETTEDTEEIKYMIQDWLSLDAKRIFIPDSFDFTIETIGVFSNIDILKKSLIILIEKLKKIIEIYSSSNNLIKPSNNTINNSFDIFLENEDYTIGKILEYVLYNKYFVEDKILEYCTFHKPHPHINISKLILGFKDEKTIQEIAEFLIESTNIAIQIFSKISEIL